MRVRSAFDWTALRLTRPTSRATRSWATRSSCCSARTTRRCFLRSRREPEQRWERLLDTSDARWARRIQYDAAHYELTARSMVVFRLAEPPVEWRSHMSIAVAHDRRPNRNRSGTRTRSSTSCTSRRLPTATAMASATSRGSSSKLDYLADLGVTCLWLLPMYPSPLPRRRLRHRGLLQHPSELRHSRRLSRVPRCRACPSPSRRDRAGAQPHLRPACLVQGSPDFARQPAGATGTSGATPTIGTSGVRIIFIDTERSNWAWDPESKAYYWHRFFSHQPDLNYDNPAVREEMWNVMRFWLGLGVDGFRVDAVPYLIEREDTSCEGPARDPRRHQVSACAAR